MNFTGEVTLPKPQRGKRPIRHQWPTRGILNYLDEHPATFLELLDVFTHKGTASTTGLRARLKKMVIKGEIVEENGKYRIV